MLSCERPQAVGANKNDFSFLGTAHKALVSVLGLT